MPLFRDRPARAEVTLRPTISQYFIGGMMPESANPVHWFKTTDFGF